jgi:hypothetical protein
VTEAGGPPPAEAPPPVTGEAAVDEAMAGLADLGSIPVADHHERLARAHEALHQVMHPSSDPAR